MPALYAQWAANEPNPELRSGHLIIADCRAALERGFEAARKVHPTTYAFWARLYSEEKVTGGLPRGGAMTMDIDAARLGLLTFIAKKGGSIPMRDLHTHSLIFYQAGHQAFSQLMEGLVADEYVTVDDAGGAFQLTDTGRAFLESQGS